MAPQLGAAVLAVLLLGRSGSRHVLSTGLDAMGDDTVTNGGASSVDEDAAARIWPGN